ncbi:MAG: hypothetical protein LBB90_10200 [Tannerella sp.]|jgi:hypothetical protein|nr:hypothetical protein [Tannerella sp.]
MWKRMYYRLRLTKYTDWLWKGSQTWSSIAGCLLPTPTTAEEYVASHVNCACCGTNGKTDELPRDVHAETNACSSSAPAETQNPTIQIKNEHYTALLGAFPSSEEFQASFSAPESESDVTSEKE